MAIKGPDSSQWKGVCFSHYLTTLMASQSAEWPRTFVHYIGRVFLSRAGNSRVLMSIHSLITANRIRLPEISASCNIIISVDCCLSHWRPKRVVGKYQCAQTYDSTYIFFNKRHQYSRFVHVSVSKIIDTTLNITKQKHKIVQFWSDPLKGPVYSTHYLCCGRPVTLRTLNMSMEGYIWKMLEASGTE